VFKTLLISAIIVCSTFVNAKPITIGIIDSGINTKYLNRLKICKRGLIDLTKRGIEDEIGHGTNIAGLVSNGLEKIDYCFILIKYYIPKEGFGNYMRQSEAIEILWKMRRSIDMIVIAGGGPGAGPVEQDRVIDILDSGVIMVTAIGNDSYNMDENCFYYPACYDKRIIVVGNGDNEKKLLQGTSSYGRVVDIYENGNNVCSFGVCLTGSSQSTAIAANKIILKFKEIKKRLKVREVKNDKKRK